jgi:hypothetical protein
MLPECLECLRGPRRRQMCIIYIIRTGFEVSYQIYKNRYNIQQRHKPFLLVRFAKLGLTDEARTKD